MCLLCLSGRLCTSTTPCGVFVALFRSISIFPAQGLSRAEDDVFLKPAPLWEDIASSIQKLDPENAEMLASVTQVKIEFPDDQVLHPLIKCEKGQTGTNQTVNLGGCPRPPFDSGGLPWRTPPPPYPLQLRPHGKYNRRNNPELEKRRIHHCTFNERMKCPWVKLWKSMARSRPALASRGTTELDKSLNFCRSAKTRAVAKCIRKVHTSKPTSGYTPCFKPIAPITWDSMSDDSHFGEKAMSPMRLKNAKMFTITAVIRIAGAVC
ncbi:unnamed protein product [Nesidiocoris tenuis]|uniref:Uncharacterized protein n=1 Tax=Nesidiocoris tenuis TaxID=355587 RepID=A0A6H5FXD7_9HEMI|nr:unnamed protein product [Nesidiocoris tenuis]